MYNDNKLEVLIEAGAQALANDVWHPPIALAILSKHEADRFRRQARLVLDAVEKAGKPKRCPHCDEIGDHDGYCGVC